MKRPALVEGKYFPKPNDYDTEHDFYWYILNDASGKLPGMGGVFNAVNLDIYHYAGNNPVKLVDPDGEALNFAVGAIIGFTTSAAAEITNHWKDTGQGTMANFLNAAKATINDNTSLAIIGSSTVIGAATAGLGSAVTTTTRAATTASQLAKIAAGNVVKNAVVGGTGSAANHVAQSKIKGQAINTKGTINSFFDGAVLTGVFSLAGEGISTLGRTRIVDMTTNAGGIRNPRVLYGKAQGISAAIGSSSQNLGDLIKGIIDLNKIMQDKKK